MPIESLYLPVNFRYVDIWELLFERRDREFPDDKGENDTSNPPFLSTLLIPFQ